VRIATYITGHGYGHATRSLAVLRAIRVRDPDAWLAIRTMAPERFFREALAPPLHIERVQIDVGAIERDVLFTDPVATIAALRELHSREEEIVSREVDFLHRQRVDIVLSDVPPLASEIAHRAGIPSVAIANFTWDRIYEDYPGSTDLVARIRGFYAKTTLGLEVPLGHPITAFPRKESIPIITRHPKAPREETRAALGIARDEFVVLVVLRGGELGSRSMAPTPRGVRFVSFSPFHADRVLIPGPDWQDRFPDLVAASDVVFGKPGYGIVGECMAARRPLLHLPRGGFAETPYLIEWMDRLMPHSRIEILEAASPRFYDLARDSASSGFVWPEVRLNGDGVAAEFVWKLLVSCKTSE